jgi:hypothetical protein
LPKLRLDIIANIVDIIVEGQRYAPADSGFLTGWDDRFVAFDMISFFCYRMPPSKTGACLFLPRSVAKAPANRFELTQVSS